MRCIVLRTASDRKHTVHGIVLHCKSSADPYLMLIRPHTGQDDVVLLSALEGVHTGYLNVGIQLLPHGAIAQHDLQHVGALPLIGGDHPQLV